MVCLGVPFLSQVPFFCLDCQICFFEMWKIIIKILSFILCSLTLLSHVGYRCRCCSLQLLGGHVWSDWSVGIGCIFGNVWLPKRVPCQKIVGFRHEDWESRGWLMSEIDEYSQVSGRWIVSEHILFRLVIFIFNTFIRNIMAKRQGSFSMVFDLLSLWNIICQKSNLTRSMLSRDLKFLEILSSRISLHTWSTWTGITHLTFTTRRSHF